MIFKLSKTYYKNVYIYIYTYICICTHIFSQFILYWLYIRNKDRDASSID